MARSSRSECHPERREPPSLTLRSFGLTRHLRPLGQRRRGCQHLLQDLDRSLCVSTAPDGAVGPSDLAVDRPSLAVDASLCICAIRGASYARSLPLPKAGVHRGEALKRDRRFRRFHRRRDRAGCGVLTEIPLESRVAQVRKAQTKPSLADRTTLEHRCTGQKAAELSVPLRDAAVLCTPFGVGTA